VDDIEKAEELSSSLFFLSSPLLFFLFVNFKRVGISREDKLQLCCCLSIYFLQRLTTTNKTDTKVTEGPFFL